MYLKSLELQGFKSFPDKITLTFDEGFTAVVGPNGSGKSNIGDAVRWVLGEQSTKELRGKSMEDVIFSGTETRKPLSHAFVSITLDNSDHQLPTSYEEVTVARRLYRSGESEYLLNGTPCRLRDVNELFYDTGIGKEGYSIIGQGQIDQILSGKPEERRELFDEAAGIVKFKRRKMTAQKKLENERTNLVRVNDILTELERQVGPLERQSEKARIYLKHKEDLKKLDINVFLLENERLRKTLSELEEKLKISSQQLSETTERFNGVRTEYDEIQAAITTLEEQIEEARSALSDTDLNRSRLENQIELLKEQIHSASEHRALYEARRETLRKEIEDYETEKSGLLKEKESSDEDAKRIDEEAALRAQALSDVQKEIEALTDEIEEGKAQIMQAIDLRSDLVSTISSYDSAMEQIEIRKAELSARILRARSDEEEREDTISRLEEEFQSKTEELTSMQTEEKTIDQEISSLREQLSAEDAALRELQGKYHQEHSRLQALSDIAAAYDGYGQSVKKVMEQKKKYDGIVGVVADILKVDRKYEVAIETALGGNVQNIVTKDEDTAKKLIAFLKEGKHGRATFLPMDAVTNPQKLKAEDVLKEKGVLGLASRLVTVSEEYQNIIDSLLGRFVVVENVDLATKIARKYHYTIRMVTLEGELLMPGGAISGGSSKNNMNFLGKKREMDDLKKAVKKISEDIERKNKEISDLREKRNRRRSDLEALRIRMQSAVIEQNTARVNLTTARERMQEDSEMKRSLQQEHLEIEENIREIEVGKANATKQLESFEVQDHARQEKLAEQTRQLSGLQERESEAMGRVSEWEIEVHKTRQALSFKEDNLKRIEGEIEKRTGELAEIASSIEEGEKSGREKEEQIREIRATIDASYDHQEQRQQELKDRIAEKERLSAKQKSFFENREKISEEMNALDKEIYRLTSRRESTEGAIENLINYMWEEYEITLSDASTLRDESMTDLTVMKRDIAEIKDKIKKLGEVNVNAIEEYREISERYETMKTQHDDLIVAAEHLEQIIKELDEAMRRQFAEKFEEINREYDKVFKELFGGGKGSLELLDGEDILEAGILISAQPPGKKLQNMMQLSGGEKALSAIALLFAIQNLKPSPFCLLDEIEAALDDSNVGRFAKYLHKLTKNTQFIVITHRRGTMEQVDRLYGITMQEKGISTLVSVNLIENQLDN